MDRFGDKVEIDIYGIGETGKGEGAYLNAIIGRAERLRRTIVFKTSFDMGHGRILCPV